MNLLASKWTCIFSLQKNETYKSYKTFINDENSNWSGVTIPSRPIWGTWNEIAKSWPRDLQLYRWDDKRQASLVIWGSQNEWPSSTKLKLGSDIFWILHLWQWLMHYCLLLSPLTFWLSSATVSSLLLLLLADPQLLCIPLSYLAHNSCLMLLSTLPIMVACLPLHLPIQFLQSKPTSTQSVPYVITWTLYRHYPCLAVPTNHCLFTHPFSFHNRCE